MLVGHHRKIIGSHFPFKNKLKERYQNFWALQMKSGDKMSKLRTYKLIKKTFGIETYLELNERKYRKALCALRISSHKLNIERGRYLNLRWKIDCATLIFVM